MKTTIITAILMALTCHTSISAPKEPVSKSEEISSIKEQPTIQLAILLDISGSMDGLICQAQNKLWKIVNELSHTKRNDKRPNIEIAIYAHGDAQRGDDTEIRLVTPFTSDLDEISSKLFALNTSGSEELCGTVIARATTDLRWTNDENALKIIFLAGNEEITQGAISYQSAIKKATKKGITVNTIYCGNRSDYDAEGWSAAAKIGDGNYLCINQNSRAYDPETPYDKELADLSKKLNGTYVAYGKQQLRKAKMCEQIAIDDKAVEVAPSIAAERAITKANKDAYKNSGWDLVDAEAADQGANIGALATTEEGQAQLPDELKGKSEEEIKAYIKKKSDERTSIQNQISAINDKRQTWLSEERKKNTDSEESTLDTAIIKAIQKQAEDKGFSINQKD